MTFKEHLKKAEKMEQKEFQKPAQNNRVKIRFDDKEFGKSSENDYPLFTTNNKYGYRVHINNAFAHKKYLEWKKRVGVKDIPSDAQRLEFEEEFIEKIRTGEYVVPDYRKTKNKDDLDR